MEALAITFGHLELESQRTVPSIDLTTAPAGTLVLNNPHRLLEIITFVNLVTQPQISYLDFSTAVTSSGMESSAVAKALAALVLHGLA